VNQTIVQQLAEFTFETNLERFPPAVIDECKRLLLDSIGCALAARDHPKGRAGIAYGRVLGATAREATIITTGEKASVLGAAFANGELINALDMDAVLPPGHVTPYVVPAALAMAESMKVSGSLLIEALACSHEISFRFGKAMDNLRDTQNGQVNPPKVFGYASSIFGATAAVGKVRGLASETLAQALGIAGYISPVNPQVAWFQSAPSSTIKYLMAGMLAQQALTAAYAAEFGHCGDVMVLDDREYGYPRFIGTVKWEPDHITNGLGREWLFPAFVSFKPYPHCRIMHSLLDILLDIVERHDIKPHEIDSIKVFVEGMAERPVWLNRTIERVHDAQFSMAHGIALAAHRVTPGKAWQAPELVFSPSVMRLMDKVTHEVHPDYVKLLNDNVASRPAKLVIQARGETYVGEKRYPKGSPSPEPGTRMTNDELIAKFRHNAEEALTSSAVDSLADAVMNLEAVRNVATIVELTAQVASSVREKAKAGEGVGA
jgi:2-methylcitrate dehydratase PrpD